MPAISQGPPPPRRWSPLRNQFQHFACWLRSAAVLLFRLEVHPMQFVCEPPGPWAMPYLAVPGAAILRCISAGHAGRSEMNGRLHLVHPAGDDIALALLHRVEPLLRHKSGIALFRGTEFDVEHVGASENSVSVALSIRQVTVTPPSPICGAGTEPYDDRNVIIVLCKGVSSWERSRQNRRCRPRNLETISSARPCKKRLPRVRAPNHISSTKGKRQEAVYSLKRTIRTRLRQDNDAGGTVGRPVGCLSQHGDRHDGFNST